tara:strand:- start:9260 stop:10033 length:774 start_codon:yes stop_codon:yes gene_type:complete
MSNLNNKVAIVTGGTSGIGRSCCQVLAEQGASIIVTGRNQERGVQTIDLIREAGGEGLFFEHDICSQESWVECIEFTKKSFGHIDILINNAGAFLIKSIEETSVDEFKSLIKTNVNSVFLGMKHVMPELDKSGGGAIVNVSSLMGVVGLEDGAAYCASKGAICGMTRSVALEAAANGRNIRINTMVPGVIWTEMLAEAFGEDEELKTNLMNLNPMKRMGQPTDIAQAILYLVSDESSFVTGTELIVDGGRGAGARGA